MLDPIALAALLHEEPGERVIAIADAMEGWSPEPGRCHENVDRWVELNPRFRPVRGWLRGGHFPTPPNRVSYASHSVVAGPSGTLFDVTLNANQAKYAFIRHPGTEEEFLSATRRNGLPWIEHLVSPDPPHAPMVPPLHELPDASTSHF